MRTFTSTFLQMVLKNLCFKHRCKIMCFFIVLTYNMINLFVISVAKVPKYRTLKIVAKLGLGLCSSYNMKFKGKEQSVIHKPTLNQQSIQVVYPQYITPACSEHQQPKIAATNHPNLTTNPQNQTTTEQSTIQNGRRKTGITPHKIYFTINVWKHCEPVIYISNYHSCLCPVEFDPSPLRAKS